MNAANRPLGMEQHSKTSQVCRANMAVGDRPQPAEAALLSAPKEVISTGVSECSTAAPLPSCPLPFDPVAKTLPSSVRNTVCAVWADWHCPAETAATAGAMSTSVGRQARPVPPVPSCPRLQTKTRVASACWQAEAGCRGQVRVHQAGARTCSARQQRLARRSGGTPCAGRRLRSL